MSIFLLIWFLPLLISGKSIYDFKLKDISGNEVDFKQFKGKVNIFVMEIFNNALKEFQRKFDMNKSE